MGVDDRQESGVSWRNGDGRASKSLRMRVYADRCESCVKHEFDKLIPTCAIFIYSRLGGGSYSITKTHLNLGCPPII